MNVLQGILQWSRSTLPEWQQDALRRLMKTSGAINDSDLEELYLMLKQAHGIPVKTKLSPTPLAATHLPAKLKAGETMVLRAMRELRNVNRLAPNQEIVFSAQGLTVVYGGNGAGKSGYARVLKAACRSRDDGRTIHPDATDPASTTHLPEATFDLEYNAVQSTVRWIADTPPPEELATIGVFDGHCARAYLTTEQDVAYLPYGLDVVESLANHVLPALSEKLQQEIAGINTDASPFAHLRGDTQVGRIASALGPTTDLDQIKRLASLSAREVERLAQLEKTLSEGDKRLKAKELRLSADRIKRLAEQITTAGVWVTDAAVTKLQALDRDAEAAGAAEKTAANDFRAADDLLPGTGERAWELLFNAAKAYSVEVAYPGMSFPHTVDGAKCVLCQQPLGEAAARLERFADYLKSNVAETAEKSRRKVDEARKRIASADLGVDLDRALAAELDLVDSTASSTAGTWMAAVEARRKWMLAALDTHQWDSPPPLPQSPSAQLRGLVAKQLRAARMFQRASDEKKREALAREQAELAARKNLSVCATGMIDLVQRMKQKRTLETCAKDLRTRPITEASKKLAASAVTEALKLALDREFSALGVGHIRTVLKERNVKGTIKHRLLLDVPQAFKLDEVLSEGEQRAIALASFLAELDLASHFGGIVFDDPVSSLDHHRRRRVAQRFARESKRRQVIVFTHDVVFLQQLIDTSEKLGAKPTLYFLEHIGGYAGSVAAGLPWDHKSVADRIDKLEKAQKRLEKLPWPAYPSEDQAREMIRQYSFLRATIERTVQDFLLAGTVQRFRDYIDVKKLEQVVGLDAAEVKELLRLNQRCHDLVEAHDPSSAKDEAPPTPVELHKDIADLKALIKRVKDQRKNANVS